MSGHTKLGFTLLGGELGTLGQRSYHSDDWLVWIVAMYHRRIQFGLLFLLVPKTGLQGLSRNQTGRVYPTF